MACLSSVPISLLLLASLAAAASAAAADQEEGGIRIRVRYPTKEQSQWLDRWAEKHQAQGSGEGFRIRPATDEESAFLNACQPAVRRKPAAEPATTAALSLATNIRMLHPPQSSHPCPHTIELCSTCAACLLALTMDIEFRFWGAEESLWMPSTLELTRPRRTMIFRSIGARSGCRVSLACFSSLFFLLICFSSLLWRCGQ